MIKGGLEQCKWQLAEVEKQLGAQEIRQLVGV